MKNISNVLIILFSILILLSCCNAEKEIVPEYINYAKEIFSGRDTLIYGDWAYLYSIDGYSGSKSQNKKPDINIRPIGNYEFLSNADHTVIQIGKIDTFHHSNGRLSIAFRRDGNKSYPLEFLAIKYFYFIGSDTLYFYPVGCSDCPEDFYLRIKLLPASN